MGPLGFHFGSKRDPCEEHDMAKPKEARDDSASDRDITLITWITSLKDRMKPSMSKQDEAFCGLPLTPSGEKPEGHTLELEEETVLPGIQLRSSAVKAFVTREYIEVFSKFPADREVEQIITVLESYALTNVERKSVRSYGVLEDRHEPLAAVIEEVAKTGGKFVNDRLLDRVRSTAMKMGVKQTSLPRNAQDLGNTLGKLARVMRRRGVILKPWKEPKTSARGWEIGRVKSTPAAIAPKLDGTPAPKEGTVPTPSDTRTAPPGTEAAPAATPTSSGVVSEDVGVGETGHAGGDDGTSDLGNDGDGEDFTDAGESAELRAVLNELDGSKGGAA